MTPATFDVALARVLEQAKAAWPGLRADSVAFAEHVAGRLPNKRAAAEELARLHAADLYLAYCCLAGDATALSALRDVMGRALKGVDPETRQALEERLLVEKKLSDFSGKGPLAAWLKVSAARATLTRARAQRRRAAAEQHAFLDVPVTDPELAFIRARYRDDFRRAFTAALAGLSARDRAVLKLHTVERLSIDAIAKVYGTHRATAARWLEHAREEIFSATKASLEQRLALDRADGSSLFRLLKAELDVSLGSFLKKG